MTKRTVHFSIFFVLELILGRFLAGIVPIFVKITAANSYEIGIARLGIAAILFAGGILFLKRKIRFTRKNIFACLAIGVSFGLHWLLYFFSIKLSNVTVASIGVASYGVFLMLMGNLFFHEKITKKEIYALILALVGSLLVIPNYDFANSVTIGFILGLINAFLFAITASIHKYTAKKINFETRIFSQYFFALFIFLPFLGETNWHFQNIDWIYLIILAIPCTLVAHTLWMREVEKLDLKTAGIIYYGATVFSVMAGILIFKDPLSWRSFLGGALILFASVIATLKSSKKVELELEEL